MKALFAIFLSTTLVAAPDLTSWRCTFVDGSPMVLKQGNDYACVGYVMCTKKESKIKDLKIEDSKYTTFLCSIPQHACRNDRLSPSDMIPLITFAKDCGKEDKGGSFNLEPSPNSPQ